MRKPLLRFGLAVVVLWAVCLTAAWPAPFQADDTGVYEGTAGLVPHVNSIAELRAVARYQGKAVHLADIWRNAVYVWDGTMPAALAAALDPLEINTILAVPGANGAWVNPTADPRMGIFANSIVPARKLRANSGLFVGANAATFTGDVASQFWVHEISDGRGPNGWDWTVTTAKNIFEHDGGQINTSIVTRSAPNAGGLTIGLVNSVVARSKNNNHGAWALYSDAIAEPGNVGNVTNAELNIVNKFGPLANPGGELPYTVPRRGLRYTLGLAAGGDATVHGATFDVDQAIRLNANGAQFFSGFMLRHNSLVTDAQGESRAMAMGLGHSLVWYGPGNAEAFRLVSTGDGSRNWRVDAGQDDYTVSADDAPVLRLTPTAGATSYLQVRTAASGAPVLAVAGSAPDADLRLEPQGAGLLSIAATAVPVSPEFVATHSVAIRVHAEDGTETVVYLPVSLVP